METLGPGRGKSQEGGFLNFLRGMETQLVALSRRHQTHFLNFLRGMETRRRHNLR